MKISRVVIEAAIVGFENQKKKIDNQVAELRAMLDTKAENNPPATEQIDSTPRKHHISAAGRRAIAKAQRARWAAQKAAAAEPQKKSRLSPEGRAAIIAATKKRWAAKKTSTGETAAPKKEKKRRRFSKKTRARMAAAQKARWAKKS